ncbi:MAG: hypothetical protein GWP16_03660 [Nitrospirae bacterium]|nr:hypothetical protein [Nitrospirota bacterium]
MRQTALLLVPLTMLLTASSFGCAFGEIRPKDPLDRQYTLEAAHKNYTDLVRWSKFEEAAGFMDSESRTAFLSAMPDFNEVRFTDWKAKPWELDEELRETTIEVTYKGYSMRSPIEVAVQESQHWSRSGRSNDWNVSSSFEGLDQWTNH